MNTVNVSVSEIGDTVRIKKFSIEPQITWPVFPDFREYMGASLLTVQQYFYVPFKSNSHTRSWGFKEA